jgi:hypothetical protein
MRRTLSAVVLCVSLAGVWGCSLPWKANKGVQAAELNPVAAGTRNAFFTASNGHASTDANPQDMRTRNQSGW